MLMHLTSAPACQLQIHSALPDSNHWKYLFYPLGSSSLPASVLRVQLRSQNFTETHFIIAKQLLVTAVLQESATSIICYRPAGTWAQIFMAHLSSLRKNESHPPWLIFNLRSHSRRVDCANREHLWIDLHGNWESSDHADLHLHSPEKSNCWCRWELIYDNGKEQQDKIEDGDFKRDRLHSRTCLVELHQTPLLRVYWEIFGSTTGRVQLLSLWG